MATLNLSPNTMLSTVSNFFNDYGLEITFYLQSLRGINDGTLANHRLSEISAKSGGSMVVSPQMKVGDFISQFETEFGTRPIITVNGEHDPIIEMGQIQYSRKTYLQFKKDAAQWL